MPEITIIIPGQQAELEVAIVEFVKGEYAQEIHFRQETASRERLKDVGLLTTMMQSDLMQIATIIAVAETTLQFAERVKRMERVKKLLEVIKQTGNSVYLKINQDKAVDLSQKSVDETMDLLSKKDDSEPKL